MSVRQRQAYLAQRRQRDHPTVYQQFLYGKFRSIRAAATAAGIANSNVLCALRYHWKRATQAQREQFLFEVCDDVLRSQDAIKDA